ncbi:selenide, water dikinase SelD [bacterium]|nr:selenide, water dikinase SelD [bacterium]
MQDATLPLVRDLVLIGGGHTHALILRMWAMKPLPGVRLTLINPDPVAPYTGMLPGLIAGHYRREEILIDLVRLARFAGARLILDRATGLDRAARQVLLAGRPPLPYDLASLDIGITSDLPELPGFAEHTHSAKPLGAYARAWEAFVARALPTPEVVIIGGGVGGVELAMASAHRLRQTGAAPGVTLIDRGPVLLPLLSAQSRAGLAAALQAQGVRVITSASPAQAEAGRVVLQGGRVLPADFTLTVAGSRPYPWLQDTGLVLHEGYVSVDAELRSSDPLVFAAGDCAHLSHAPRPKAGVYAVRAAPVLLANLRASLTGQSLRPFHPQRDYLKLISLGTKSALADKWGLRAGGPWLWRIKDRIDARFMAKFADYPAMPAPALPAPAVTGMAEAMGDKPLCGGCGAKVGTQGLSTMLASLPRPRRPEVLAGAGDDAAILRANGGVQVITTDHLRSFTCDPRLMARLTAIHALGDIWAMGARPQVALAQVILPRLSPDLQGRMLADVMGAAAEVFGAAGADVVGGHSSQGAELTIGFTVTGLAETPVTKGGAQPGDALILTKALGSGTILAAEMAMARPPDLMLGEIVAACHARMQRPQAEASALLAPAAHAMTDVTGFGLAGHLLEMMEASGTAARLWLDAVPLMPGAEALAALGEHSSLAPSNRAALLGRIRGESLASPRAALLVDPQTCGGLLASVPKARAEALLAGLHATGDLDTALIGEVIAGPPVLHLTTGAA